MLPLSGWIPTTPALAEGTVRGRDMGADGGSEIGVVSGRKAGRADKDSIGWYSSSSSSSSSSFSSV